MTNREAGAPVFGTTSNPTMAQTTPRIGIGEGPRVVEQSEPILLAVRRAHRDAREEQVEEEIWAVDREFASQALDLGHDVPALNMCGAVAPD